ncbi:MAG: hypothetical protein NT056_07025 [Proteobacteria bacterium]|nr:hypothetical protein [Pseudomonadota bacterium]
MAGKKNLRVSRKSLLFWMENQRFIIAGCFYLNPKNTVESIPVSSAGGFFCSLPINRRFPKVPDPSRIVINPSEVGTSPSKIGINKSGNYETLGKNNSFLQVKNGSRNIPGKDQDLSSYGPDVKFRGGVRHLAGIQGPDLEAMRTVSQTRVIGGGGAGRPYLRVHSAFEGTITQIALEFKSRAGRIAGVGGFGGQGGFGDGGVRRGPATSGTGRGRKKCRDQGEDFQPIQIHKGLSDVYDIL